MNQNLHDILNRALQEEEYPSLKVFYQAHSFSFSYEYLRKIFTGERIPQAKRIEELAKALRLDPKQLHRQAETTRFAQKVRQHYRLPPATELGRFSEKIRRYRQEGKTEERIMKLVQQLGQKEKDQLLQYLRFLRQQWRRKKRDEKR